MAHRHLAEANEHIAQGKATIAKQRAVVAELERKGRDSSLAKEVLDVLLYLQATHERHRDMILRELGRRQGGR